MKSRIEATDDAVGSSVTASFVGAVRHAVLATAVALPMAMLATMDNFESDFDCASAGELWLDIQNRMRAVSEPLDCP